MSPANSVPFFVTLTVLACLLSFVGAALPDTGRCRIVPDGTAPDRLIVDCSYRKLDKLPRQLFDKRVVELDLSGNSFKTLASMAFLRLTNLKKLNISKCGIESLSKSTFRGLAVLEELDVKNNPFIGRPLPERIFDDLPALRRLYISGSVTNTGDMARWGNLKKLAEIILTPGAGDHFHHLRELPSLVSVYFVFCRIGAVLRPSTLLAFRNSTIRQLAFVACRLRMVENGTFDGLSTLDVLNLAGNAELSVDVVINALSTSADVAVRTLILDGVGSSYHLFIGGERDRAGCRSAWRHLVRLSIRGINLVGVRRAASHCLPKLETVAFGFNAVEECGRGWLDCLLIVSNTVQHLRAIDMSYFMVSDMPGLQMINGYDTSSNWVMMNDDYFPPIDGNASASCTAPDRVMIHVGHTDSGCRLFPMPPCLIYARADHWFRNLFMKNAVGPCLQFANNSLAYLNFSARFYGAKQPLILNRTVYGLTKLKVLDLSQFGIVYVDFGIFENFSSLELLNLADNGLGQKPLTRFGRAPRLAELSLAANYIGRFPARMFAELVALRRLDVSKNQLTRIDFELPSSLEFFDVSNNLLASLDGRAQAALSGDHSLSVVRVDHNPFHCNCPETGFIRWYQSSVTATRLFANHEKITCQQNVRSMSIASVDVPALEVKCGLTVNTIVITSVFFSFVLTTVIFFVLLYRYRWLIRWKYYELRYQRRQRTRNILQENDYSAYVIYPTEDEQVCNWVFRSLLPGVEGRLNKPAMFVRDRDDYVGHSFNDEIIRGIKHSQTAIWILCPAFFQDKWCEIAANFAFLEFGRKNNLLVIWDSSFRKKPMARGFASLVHPKIGMSEVKYATSEHGSRLFWAKLDSFLPNWSISSSNSRL